MSLFVQDFLRFLCGFFPENFCVVYSQIACSDRLFSLDKFFSDRSYFAYSAFVRDISLAVHVSNIDDSCANMIKGSAIAHGKRSIKHAGRTRPLYRAV